MEVTLLIAGILVALALFFDFTNGFHDAANQVATVIASNALTPAVALVLAALGDFIGAYFLGTAVAQTLGKGIVDPLLLQTRVNGVSIIIAALIGAILWNLLTWRVGLPSSSSHGLIGGLIGAFVVGCGFYIVNWSKVVYIIIVMLCSPLVGFIATYIFTRLTFSISQWFTPYANRAFKKLQVVSLFTQALSHGTNDAQKTMGVIVFGLIALGLYIPPQDALLIPSSVIITCALAIACGTLVGGWRIIKTLGRGLYTIRPLHSFASQVASTAIIYLTALFGYPISTTQVISSSVMGAGAATRPSMVRWIVAREMALAWLVTIPASAVIAGFSLFLLNAFL